MQWTRNDAVECVLRRNGIPFHYEDIPYSQINVKRGLANQARLTTPLIDDVVTQYGIGFERGDPFPSLVVHKNGRGYDPDDGNHRLAGGELAGVFKPDTPVGCVVLDTDDDMLLALARSVLNRTNGLQQEREEAVQHALNMIEKFPHLKQGEVAKEFGLTETFLSRAIRAKRTVDILEDRHVKTGSLKRSVVLELSKLSRSEPVMAAAADVTVRHALVGREVEGLVAAATSKRSEARQIQAVQEYEEELEKYAPRRIERKASPKGSFLRSLHALFGVVAKHPTAEHLQLTSKSEYQEAKRDWEQVRDRLNKVFAK